MKRSRRLVAIALLIMVVPLAAHADAPRSNQESLAADLVAVAADASVPASERALRAAGVAFGSHDRGSGLHASLAPLVAQERRNLDAVRALLPLLDPNGGDALVRAIAVAEVVTDVQRDALGSADASPAVPLRHHASLEQAVRALAARGGADVDVHGGAPLALVAALPPAMQRALLRTVDAFVAFYDAIAAGFESAAIVPPDPAVLTDAHTLRHGVLKFENGAIERSLPSRRQLAVAFGPALAARQRFLASLPALREALPRSTLAGPCEPIALPPAIALDLTGCDSAYTENILLLIDAGGNDVYQNNAGGFPGTLNVFPPAAAGAAALVDFAGDDQYVDAPGSGKGLLAPIGTNGAAYGGAGILVDVLGDDRYARAGFASNGGGYLGKGLLVDADGANVYEGGDYSTNGGSLLGSGGLVDLGVGNTNYTAGIAVGEYPPVGANGGGCYTAYSFLVDAGGADRYETPSAISCGSNGGAAGANPATGFLLDAGEADDVYVGMNGGSAILSAGFLFDEGGDDSYTGPAFGASHGGAWFSVGALLDATGDDDYHGGFFGTNGGAMQGGAGHLLDLGGTDSYTAGGFGTNGGGATQGFGMLFDAAGHDVYTAGSIATNGGAFFAGRGLLLDSAGDDAYRAGSSGVNGAGNTTWPGVGALLDLAGRDTYEDGDGGTGVDMTVAPKGTFGAQIDHGGNS